MWQLPRGVKLRTAGARQCKGSRPYIAQNQGITSIFLIRHSDRLDERKDGFKVESLRSAGTVLGTSSFGNRPMNALIWHKVAGLSGAAAVGLGAYGAHAFKPQDPYFVEVFDRGNKYHLLHSLLLAAAPLAKRPSAVGACTTAGILLFSGSCYAAAFTEDRANAKLAPFGGMSLIAAWLCLLL